MDAGEFLSHVWPASGKHFCIAWPYPNGGFHQVTFTDIPSAAAYAMEQSRQGKDMYFNVHALKEEKVWNAKLDDGVGAWQVRTHANMDMCYVFFSDIDVGSDKPYKTRADAIRGLEQFLQDTKLPRPLVVTSGGGFHIYWLIETPLSSDDWHVAAKKLKAVAQHFKFHIDPSRTTDRSSVLRVVGTFNHKDRSNPRPVEAKYVPQARTVTTEFLTILDRSSIFAAGSVSVPVQSAAALDAKPVSLVDVGKACGVVRELVATADKHSEPQWHAFLGLMLYVENGREWAHKVSARYPTYSREETDEKMEKVAERQTGPTRCQRLSDMGFAAICDQCWYKDQRAKSSPTVAARRRPRDRKPDEIIPDPPEPFRRVAAGGVVMVEDEVQTVISPFDIYPARLVADFSTGESVMHADWSADLPNGRGIRTFRLPLRNIQELTLSSKLADHGIILEFDSVKHVRRYMTLYIQKLQQSMNDTKQHGHLGYNDDYTEFVLPHATLTGGDPKPSIISDDVRSAMRSVTRKGTLGEQVKALTFYDDPAYRRNQFTIGCSFGAPLLYMTGQHGVIVNVSGESGASKSTTLYAAGSIWGDGEAFTLNGTNNGMTANARMHRLAMTHNLPMIVDEITYMDDRDAKDLSMAITQSHEKIKLDRMSKEKAPAASSQRSTIMLTSSNGSFHEKLSARNVAGTASSMRAFEMDYPRTTVHDKRQADDFLRTIREHHGHMGPIYMQFVMTNQAAVARQVVEMQRRIDDAADVMPHERFWSAVGAVSIVGLGIAKRLGLTSYDPEAVFRWLVEEQFPAMRGTMASNYADPLDMLIAYLNTSKGDALVVNNINGNVVAIDKPLRECGLRYEVDSRLVTISINHLKNYCFRRNIAFGAMVDVLVKNHGATKVKTTIGRGIPEYAYGQVQCLQLSLQTEEAMGKVDFAMSQETSNVVALRKGLIR